MGLRPLQGRQRVHVLALDANERAWARSQLLDHLKQSRLSQRSSDYQVRAALAARLFLEALISVRQAGVTREDIRQMHIAPHEVSSHS